MDLFALINHQDFAFLQDSHVVSSLIAGATCVAGRRILVGKSRRIDGLFPLFAAAFLVASVYHFVGLYLCGSDQHTDVVFLSLNHADRATHALFGVLNLTFALLFMFEASFLKHTVLALTLQQIYSHGVRMHEFHASNELDYISAIVIVGLMVLADWLLFN